MIYCCLRILSKIWSLIWYTLPFSSVESSMFNMSKLYLDFMSLYCSSFLVLLSSSALWDVHFLCELLRHIHILLFFQAYLLFLFLRHQLPVPLDFIQIFLALHFVFLTDFLDSLHTYFSLRIIAACRCFSSRFLFFSSLPELGVSSIHILNAVLSWQTLGGGSRWDRRFRESHINLEVYWTSR